MPQADGNVANATGAVFRADLNNQLLALFTNSSGNAAPSSTYAHQFWVNTGVTPAELNVRNAANNGWIVLGKLDGTSGFGGFPSGTAMTFVQTSAPTGWTKSTTHDNKALRVVSGTAGSGGTVSFTTAFTSRTVAGTVGNTTLSTSQIPSHTHTIVGLSSGAGFGYSTTSGNNGTANTGATGGGGTHTHSFTGTNIDLAVQYVDVIIATKD